MKSLACILLIALISNCAFSQADVIFPIGGFLSTLDFRKPDTVLVNEDRLIIYTPLDLTSYFDTATQKLWVANSFEMVSDHGDTVKGMDKLRDWNFGMLYPEGANSTSASLILPKKGREVYFFNLSIPDSIYQNGLQEGYHNIIYGLSI